MVSAEKRTLGSELFLFCITIFWGSGFAVMKIATETLSPACIIAARYFVAAVLLAAFFFKRLKKISRPCLLGGLLLGAFNFTAMQVQTLGLKYTTAGKNAFLTAAYCVIVPFLYWMVRKKRPTAVNLVSAAVCIAGIGLLSIKSGFTVGFGDLLSLVSTFAFAAQIVTASILTEKNDPILLSLIQTVSTAVFALPFAVSDGIPAHISAESVFSLLYLGIFCTMVASVGQFICQKYTPPAQASLIMSMESVFGTLFGIVFLHEAVTPRLFAGFALIFAAVLLSVLKPPRFSAARHPSRTDTVLHDHSGS